ncbi:MAG: RDD family protein [Candidatus Eremiobacteraeota bacterium]|nr:RDD family protein [Candidatus Eremiobacteraeota bacterium]
MPRVEAPPPRPHVEEGVVEPPPPAGSAEPVRVSPAAPVAAPVAGTVLPPRTAATVPERPRFVFGNPLGYVVARFFAFVLDVALVTMFVTTLAYSLIAINPLTGLPTSSQGGFEATLILGIAVALVYVWVCEAFIGTTIWKLAFGLHVYNVRGGMVGLGRAFVRNLLRPIDLLVIGGILAMLPGHRRLGDLAGGTVVARSPLRAFAPLVGWILIIILAGLPFVIVGAIPALAALSKFIEIAPGIVAHVVVFVQTLLGVAHR